MENKFAFIILCAFGENKGFALPYTEWEGDTISETLAAIFTQGQKGIPIGETTADKLNLPVPSLSVGDICIVDGNYYIINNSGWIKVSGADAIRWQSVPSREITMGFGWVNDFFINKGLKPIHGTEVNVEF
jgi:hypothetical protein